MLKSFMFASQPNHASNRPRRLHPPHSKHAHPDPNRCHPDSNYCHPELSEGSAFLSPVAHRRSPLALTPLTPFLATLIVASQLTENPATLSPVLATLTRRVKPNPFVCHSYKKHPGWGSHSSNQNPAFLPAPNHKSPVTARVLSLPPVTSYQSRMTKSFIIRTYAKHTRNPFRIRTSKTLDLKSFRIRTYEKKGGGIPAKHILRPLGSPPS